MIEAIIEKWVGNVSWSFTALALYVSVGNVEYSYNSPEALEIGLPSNIRKLAYSLNGYGEELFGYHTGSLPGFGKRGVFVRYDSDLVVAVQWIDKANGGKIYARQITTKIRKFLDEQARQASAGIRER